MLCKTFAVSVACAEYRALLPHQTLPAAVESLLQYLLAGQKPKDYAHQCARSN